MSPFAMSPFASRENQRARVWFQQPSLSGLRIAIRNRLARLTASPQQTTEPQPALSTYSPDGRWRTWATTDPGTDLQTWHIQPADGTNHPTETVSGVYPTGIAWLPDGRGFFYDRPMPFGDSYALYFHSPGIPQRQDRCILYRPEHPGWTYQPHVSPDGKWLAVVILNGSAANRLSLLPLADRMDASTITEIIPNFVGRYDIVHWHEDRLILRAVEPDAPNGRLIAVDLATGDRTIVLPQGDLPLQHAAPLGDGWVAAYLNQGRSDLRWLDAGGALLETIPLPGLGTVDWLEVEEPDPEVRLLQEVELLPRLRFAYTDFARPTQAYTWQPGDSLCQPERDPPPLAFDPADFVTHAHTIPSADGTPVPIFLAHHRDTILRHCPTLLTAYGGLGVSLTPRFTPDLLAWMEMGGLLVSVCARGGGELGASWHRAGVGAHKQRTFDDVLAAAHWLLEKGATTSARLGLWGVSNGGLTAGACLTQQPDTFGAVVIDAGLLDMLDYPRLGRGSDWLAEYGNPNDPAMRDVLAAYSPLHNIRPGTAYPATLITTSDHDPRVGEAHSLRFAHRLQAAQAGPAPILLRTYPGGGHGDALSAAQQLDRAADRLTFLALHLGIGIERG